MRLPGPTHLVLFGHSSRELSALLPALQEFLDHARLRLHPTKCHVAPTRDGVPFLGWRIYPSHRLLRRPTGLRFQRRLRQLTRAHAAGALPMDRVRASVMSWLGHLQHGDTDGLRRKLLSAAVFGATKA